VRLAGLAVAAVVASTAGAVEAPARVDLIIVGDVVGESAADIMPDDGTLWVDPYMQFDTRVQISKVVRGQASAACVQVVSIRKSNRSGPRSALWWLKLRADGRYDVVCSDEAEKVVANRFELAKDVLIPKDWRRLTPCDPRD
jgi:hypothetical protein